MVAPQELPFFSRYESVPELENLHDLIASKILTAYTGWAVFHFGGCPYHGECRFSTAEGSFAVRAHLP